VQNDFQRLPVFLIHSEKEQWQHENHHAKSRKAWIISRIFEQKEARQTDESRRAKANELPFCQTKEHFGFYPRQITRDGNIRCYFSSPPY